MEAVLNGMLAMCLERVINSDQQLLVREAPNRSVIYAERRTGKTEFAIAYTLCKAATFEPKAGNAGLFVLAADTHTQAILIFWDRLLVMLNAADLAHAAWKSKGRVVLKNGATIQVASARANNFEGTHVDGVVMDGCENAPAYFKQINPSLWAGDSFAEGWAMLIERPGDPVPAPMSEWPVYVWNPDSSMWPPNEATTRARELGLAKRGAL